MKFLSMITLLIISLYSNRLISAQNYIDSTNTDLKSGISVNGENDIVITKKGEQLINTINGHANVSMTRIGKDGKLETYCTNSADQIKRFHAGESLESIQGRIK